MYMVSSVGKVNNVINNYVKKKPPFFEETVNQQAKSTISIFLNTQRKINQTPYPKLIKEPEELVKMPDSVRIFSEQMSSLTQVEFENSLRGLDVQQEYLNWVRNLGVDLMSIKPGSIVDTYA